MLIADRRLSEAICSASPYRNYAPRSTKPKCSICGEALYSKASAHAQCLYLESISAVPGAGEVKEPRSDIETGRDGDAGRH